MSVVGQVHLLDELLSVLFEDLVGFELRELSLLFSLFDLLQFRESAGFLVHSLASARRQDSRREVDVVAVSTLERLRRGQREFSSERRRFLFLSVFGDDSLMNLLCGDRPLVSECELLLVLLVKPLLFVGFIICEQLAVHGRLFVFGILIVVLVETRDCDSLVFFRSRFFVLRRLETGGLGFGAFLV